MRGYNWFTAYDNMKGCE